MANTAQEINYLAQTVINALGIDPRTEPCCEGVTNDTCADCHQLRAVTTLMVGENGDREGRVCYSCMWND